MGNCSVLVIEDDPPIRRGIVDALKFGRYRALEADTGDEGLRVATAAEIDLVLLDIVLPGKDGFTVLEELRKSRPALPVIILTARGAEDDRVRGLKLGADDYVVKPFSAKELLARVEAVLRRSAERPLDVPTITVDGRTIDFDRHEIRHGAGERIALSELEAGILQYLAANPGRAIARDELLARVWGWDPRGVTTRAVDMHIARIREKLHDDADTATIILTVRSKGYMLACEGAPGE